MIEWVIVFLMIGMAIVFLGVSLVRLSKGKSKTCFSCCKCAKCLIQIKLKD